MATPAKRGGGHKRKKQLQGHYGIDCPGDVAMMFIYAIVATLSCFILFFFFSPLVRRAHLYVRFLPTQVLSFFLGFGIAMVGMMSFAYWFTIVHMLYTSLVVKYRVAARMVALVKDWPQVASALDVGCGRGLLLNTVALRLQKEGGGGKAVGVDLWLPSQGADNSMATTLKNSRLEGVNQIVTCKTGDPRDLPFEDDSFDAVLSALCVSGIGEERREKREAGAEERSRIVSDMVRVLRPGGQIVIWDLVHSPEYVSLLEKLGMEDIWMSERIAAFMLSSHIVYARRPQPQPKGKQKSK